MGVFGGGLIPYDTEVNVNTINAAYQTALNIASGAGRAEVSFTEEGNTTAFYKITVDGNVVATDFRVHEETVVRTYDFTTSFKVEYHHDGALTVYCQISYRTI